MTQLPEGFTLDAPPLPEGFTLDTDAPQSTGSPLSIAGQIGEGLLALGSAPVAEIGSGLAGIAGVIGGLAPGGESPSDKGARFVEGTRDALTFQPTSPAVQSTLEAVAPIIEGVGTAVKTIPAGVASFPIADEGELQATREFDAERQQAGEEKFGRIMDEGIGRSFGGATLEATGSPALAAAAETLPVAILTLFGLGATSKVSGKVRSLGDDVARRAKQRGINVDDGSPANVRRLREIVDEITDEQQGRIEAFREVGIENPTRAQITRSADDFQVQQELTKRSGVVRDTIESQEAVLTQTFDDAAAATGGRLKTSSSSVVDEVVGRSTKLDDKISDLYRQAREASAGQPDVDLSRFAKKVLDNLDSDGAAEGLFSAVRGELRRKGVIDQKGNVVGKVSVDAAEEIRQFINAQFDPKNRTFANSQSRVLKDVLDDDVFRASGKDIFNEARAAKAEFEQGLSAAKISRFDKNQRSLVRDILENKISPDELAEKITATKSYKPKDLRQLRDFLEQTDEGIAAFDDLRAQVLRNVKEKAFIGPEDAQGIQALSRAKLETALKAIGEDRMRILFTQEERGLINSIMKVAKLREPVRATVLGKGPSAQAIATLAQKLANNSVIAHLFDSIAVGRNGQVVLSGRVVAPELQTGRSAANLAVPAAVSQEQ